MSAWSNASECVVIILTKLLYLLVARARDNVLVNKENFELELDCRVEYVYHITVALYTVLLSSRNR